MSSRQIIFVFCSLIFTSCLEKNENLIPTWESSGEIVPPVIFSPAVEELPPENSFVWAGTVSHHLLADKQIDFWFSQIASRRNVETFFIISPSHYGLSTKIWSLADCSWKTKTAVVHTDSKIEQKIADGLGVSFDEQVFYGEHGITTLIPYIARYFPGAKVCAIAVHGEPPLNQNEAQKLSDTLAPFFDENGRKKNFLVISTDFAHHGNYEGTVFKDNRSRQFFNAPSSSSWIFCGCDNRPGIYTLSRFLTPVTRTSVIFHTNSFELSGFDENDITSYFFTLFYD
ncbi:AmmeMemoRadiSam system protein B [Treponema sp.]|uniref:AmmeMemoRadiSam system protein B n=1 Tax=Treponema sp. TaxID=166 RepID=UPI00388DBFF0